MRLAGRIDAGSAAYEIPADTKRATRLTMPRTGNLAKGSAYLDGGGSGVGAQVARLAIYDVNSSLLGQSDEIVVADGQAPAWVDFPFSLADGALGLPAGDLFAAIHAGALSSTIRVYGDDPHGAGGKSNADTYSDGPSNPFGAATGLTADLSIFLSYFEAYADIQPRETDLYYSRLPLEQSQSIFALGGPLEAHARLIDVGWHSTFLDPEIGAVALVRAGSPLEDLLGERIRIRTHGTATSHAVYAYVHDLGPEDTMPWDLSITRLLFSRLAPLATYTLSTIVDVIA